MIAADKARLGEPAPDFSLPGPSGEIVHLHEFQGRKNVVLFFYPKDHSPVCTAEACAFRDSYEVFQAAGAEVIGISADSQASHESFAGKHRLPYLLLTDTGGEVRKRYGATEMLGLMPGRVTYVIDKAGVVRHIFSGGFAVGKHISEALKMVQGLS